MLEHLLTRCNDDVFINVIEIKHSFESYILYVMISLCVFTYITYFIISLYSNVTMFYKVKIFEKLKISILFLFP